MSHSILPLALVLTILLDRLRQAPDRPSENVYLSQRSSQQAVNTSHEFKYPQSNNRIPYRRSVDLFSHRLLQQSCISESCRLKT
jgi:hypothetical protein